ncbi:MAG: GIY-YIG nuclease family protein, partial [Prevotella sp.]|nr:GIY-YIG nuclease family protein [Prevotella sp.]
MSNSTDFFTLRPQAEPEIYAYKDTNPQYKGLLKVGYTTIGVQKRVKQQYPTARPGNSPYNIAWEESAMRNDGTSFTDHDVHRYLRKKGIPNPKGEWFECSVKQVRAAI